MSRLVKFTETGPINIKPFLFSQFADVNGGIKTNANVYFFRNLVI